MERPPSPDDPAALSRGLPATVGLRLQRLMLKLPRRWRRQKLARLLAASLFRGPYVRLEFDRSQIVGNIREGAVAQALLTRHFEDYGYFELARSILRPGDVHFDLGANYGFHTFGVVPLVPDSVRHVLIDANPDCHLCHRLSLPLFPTRDIQPIHAALTDVPGNQLLQFDEDDTGQGRLVPRAAGLCRTAPVPGRRLDEIAAALRLARCRLMKIDIEGSEVRCLRGVGELLAQTDFIYFEVNPPCLAFQETSVSELFALIEAAGFLLCWPHQSKEWISRVHGQEMPAHEHRPCQPPGTDLRLFELNRALPIPKTSQFDLLAVNQALLRSPAPS